MSILCADAMEKTRKDAAKMHALLLQRLAVLKQTTVAERIGCNSSTVSRAVTDDAYRICEIMVACGFKLANHDDVLTTQKELTVMKRWSIRFLEADLNRCDCCNCGKD